MLHADVKFSNRLRIDSSVIAREASTLADDLTKLLVAENQLALLFYRKKVSGDTLYSVTRKTVQATATFHHRQVVGGAGYKFIRDGRRPGAKMPIRFVGVGPRGGKQFEPVPLLMRWFQMKGIPRAFWFVICRNIARRGIKPVPIDKRAITQAMPTVKRYVNQTQARIVRGLLINAR